MYKRPNTMPNQCKYNFSYFNNNYFYPIKVIDTSISFYVAKWYIYW